MALLDVSFLINDPDFSDTMTLIRRSYVINEFGKNILSDEVSSIIIGVVQSDKDKSSQTLTRTQRSALLSDGIFVHYKGQLIAEGQGLYADVIVWNGNRYQVKSVEENFMSYGAGFTKAFCLLESASA